MADWHVITNADLEKKVGDCAVCGPGVRLKVRVRDGNLKRGCYRGEPSREEKHPDWHRLININAEYGLADCSVCGAGISVTVREGKITKCPTKRRRPRAAGDARPFVPMRTTPEELDAAYTAQGGACAICGSPEKLRRDHDHSTGHFRGWLCATCNWSLGLFKDDPARLRKAAAYLEASLEKGSEKAPSRTSPSEQAF